MPPNSELSFGNTIQDYRLGQLLGKGGFAEVYRARCCRTGLEVAIKMIDKQEMKRRGFVDKVKNEVNIHSRLKHPYVLEAYDFFEDRDYVYLVLELCENGNLDTYLNQRGKPFSEPEAACIMKQLLDGLTYLQRNFIVHRDFSPKNLLLTKEMQVKICDFGLATELTSVDDKHYTVCGTPNFIAPEIITRSSHGMETDVWSLGCILYLLLMGKPPFEKKAIQATMTNVVMGDYPKPPAWFKLSVSARDLLDKMLQKSPSDRIKLRDVLKHSFITSYTQNRPPDKTGYHSSYNDSGLGRTMSSSGKSRFRSRSEERTSINPYNFSQNNHGSVYSEPMMESALNRDLLSDIPRPPKSLILSQCEQQQAESVRHQHQTGQNHSAGRSQKDTDQNQTDENQPTKLQVPPLNSTRLQPTRHQTKTAVLTIMGNGEVCVEFIRTTKNYMQKVYEVCRVSSDGLRIIVYKPQGVTVVGPEPPAPSAQGAVHIHSYESLPKKHHRKYLYAARYVSLVRAKTPKVTLYTQRTKCMYMENGPQPNCEMFFYDGTKLAQISGSIKITTAEGQVFSEDDSLAEGFEDYIEHYTECYKRCSLLDTTLSSLGSATGECYFPAIFGRRPQFNQSGEICTPARGKENLSQATSSPPIMPSFNATCSMASTAISHSRKADSVKNSRIVVNRAMIPNIGSAEAYGCGEIRIIFNDRSIITVKNEGRDIIYQHHEHDVGRNCIGNWQMQEKPEIKKKLAHMQEFVKKLRSMEPQRLVVPRDKPIR